jgi:hypothetical protein
MEIARPGKYSEMLLKSQGSALEWNTSIVLIGNWNIGVKRAACRNNASNRKRNGWTLG